MSPSAVMVQNHLPRPTAGPPKKTHLSSYTKMCKWCKSSNRKNIITILLLFYKSFFYMDGAGKGQYSWGRMSQSCHSLLWLRLWAPVTLWSQGLPCLRDDCRNKNKYVAICFKLKKQKQFHCFTFWMAKPAKGCLKKPPWTGLMSKSPVSFYVHRHQLKCFMILWNIINSNCPYIQALA